MSAKSETEKRLHARIKAFLDKNYPCCDHPGCCGEEEEAWALIEIAKAEGFDSPADARIKRMRGELKSLGKHLDSWESQGHTTLTIRYLRNWISKRAAEMGKP